MNNEMLHHENTLLKGEIELLRKQLNNVDRQVEFAARNISLENRPTIIGLERWKKAWMLSFGAENIDGTRVAYLNSIPKVYDLFLTEEQMQFIVREYNAKGCDEPFVCDNLKD